MPAPRPLSRSLAPIVGESLPGFLLRLSYRLNLPPARLAELAGLRSAGVRGSRLPPVLVAGIPAAALPVFTRMTRLTDGQAANSAWPPGKDATRSPAAGTATGYRRLDSPAGLRPRDALLPGVPRRGRISRPGIIRRAMAEGMAPARRLRLSRPPAAPGAPLSRLRQRRPGLPRPVRCPARNVGGRLTPLSAGQSSSRASAGGLCPPAAEPGLTRPGTSGGRTPASSPFRLRSLTSSARTVPPARSAPDWRHRRPATSPTSAHSRCWPAQHGRRPGP